MHNIITVKNISQEDR